MAIAKSCATCCHQMTNVKIAKIPLHYKIVNDRPAPSIAEPWQSVLRPCAVLCSRLLPSHDRRTTGARPALIVPQPSPNISQPSVSVSHPSPIIRQPSHNRTTTVPRPPLTKPAHNLESLAPHRAVFANVTSATVVPRL